MIQLFLHKMLSSIIQAPWNSPVKVTSLFLQLEKRNFIEPLVLLSLLYFAAAVQICIQKVSTNAIINVIPHTTVTNFPKIMSQLSYTVLTTNQKHQIQSIPNLISS